MLRKKLDYDGMSMIRKHHNHTQQTLPQHREEELQNTASHKTSGRRLNENDFPVLFKADLIFKEFSRKPSKFKYLISSLCEPCFPEKTKSYKPAHCLATHFANIENIWSESV